LTAAETARGIKFFDVVENWAKIHRPEIVQRTNALFEQSGKAESQVPPDTATIDRCETEITKLFSQQTKAFFQAFPDSEFRDLEIDCSTSGTTNNAWGR
jgi:hypothetical protein